MKLKVISKIFLFFALAIVFIGISGILVLNSEEDVFGKDSRFLNTIDIEKSSDNLKTDDHLKIDAVSSQITFHLSTDDQLSAHLEGEIFTMGFVRGEWDLKFKETSDGIEIVEGRPKGNFGINFTTAKTTINIYLPQDFQGSLAIHTVSGDIDLTLPNQVYRDVKVETVSGDLNLESLNWGEDNPSKLRFESVSGEAYLEEINVKSLNLSTTSGDVTGKHIKSEALSFSSLSGDMRLEGNFKVIHGESTSGTINLTTTSDDFNIDIDTISGDVRISIPPSDGFSYDFSTVSGDLTFKLTDYHFTLTKDQRGLVGDSASTNKVNIETVSGDVLIQ